MPISIATAGSSPRLVAGVIESVVVVSSPDALASAAISIPLPVSPKGTTRTWSAVLSAGTLNVPSAGAGPISLTGVVLSAGGSVTITILDTIAQLGSYTLTGTFDALRAEGATITVAPVDGGLCGQSGSPCAPWITTDELSACCGTVIPCSPTGAITPVDLNIALNSIQIASEWLYNLTARMFPGKCRQTIRPCNVRPSCACPTVRYPVGTSAFESGCGCGPVQEINLGCWPVCSVDEVKIGGVNQNLAGWHINDQKFLARNNYSPACVACSATQCNCALELPCCQDMNSDDSCAGTWSVTFTCGSDIPAAGKLACAKLACELSKACKNDSSCALPARVTNITRQGVTMSLLDNLDFVKDGLTGIYACDMWVKSVNPYGNRMPSVIVWSPDLPRAGRKMFSDSR